MVDVSDMSELERRIRKDAIDVARDKVLRGVQALLGQVTIEGRPLTWDHQLHTALDEFLKRNHQAIGEQGVRNFHKAYSLLIKEYPHLQEGSD